MRAQAAPSLQADLNWGSIRPQWPANRVSQKRYYTFGPFRIDVALSRLARGRDVVPIPPKAFDLLLLLARNTDRIVPKSELIETLWPNTHVEEANLTQHIYTLRRALGSGPDGEPYIELVLRRGYRLTAAVRELDADQPEPPEAGTLPHAPPASAQPLREGERRRATVLQCALADAALIAERLGAAGLRDVRRLLMECADREIRALGGVISERRADGFVALFGAAVVHEDDPRRAVLAAVAITERLQHLPAEVVRDATVAANIGISTGPLVISRFGATADVDYVAVGETMQTADLLQQCAKNGAVMIADATRQSIGGDLGVETATTALGFPAYRVVSMSRSIGRLGQQPSLAPFIGRERELALLDTLLAQTALGMGQVVGIVGEPGLGKSRLVHEFALSIAARPDAPRVLEGRCVSYGSLIPYLPLIDLVRAHSGFDEADPPDAVRQMIGRTAAAHDLPPDAAALLLRLAGLSDGSAVFDNLSPEAVKTRAFEILRLLFLKTAARTPLVVIVEDVHWIDRTSEEFLATLVHAAIGARVLLIATHRPGYRVPWMERSYATQIALGPLNPAESAQIVESVIKQSISPAVSAAILSRGEGNPFFLEELARSQVEPGSSPETIPGTIQGVIMARLDRLPENSKRLLQTASILGREAMLRLLARIWEGNTNFESELAELFRLEFLYERPSADDRVFVFKHALTQDVAYDSLLARRRRDLHLRAARALEQLYADRLEEIAATLAHHYARTDLIEEAVAWLLRAADQAARVYANAEAILHLDLAARRVERLTDGAQRDRHMLAIALRHAHSLYFIGRFRDSVDVLLPHEARVARLGDAAVTGAYAFWLAHMYSRLGEQRRAAENAQRAIAAASRAGDPATLAKAHGLLALEGHWAGRPADGLAHGRKALELLESQPDQRWWLGMSHFYVALNLLLAGRFDRGIEAAERADAVGREIGDARLQAYCRFAVGWIELSRGNHQLAIDAGRRGVELSPDRVCRVYTSMILGYALVEHAEPAAAREVLMPVIAELEGFGIPQFQALTLALLAEAARLSAAHGEAFALLERGVQVAERAQYWYAAGVSRRIRSRVHRATGNDAEALREAECALATFERIGAEFESARTRLELAELAHRSGDSERTQRELDAAIGMFTTLGEEASRRRAVELASTMGIAPDSQRRRNRPSPNAPPVPRAGGNDGDQATGGASGRSRTARRSKSASTRRRR